MRLLCGCVSLYEMLVYRHYVCISTGTVTIEAELTAQNRKPDQALNSLMMLLFVIILIDVCARVYTYGRHYFSDKLNLVDAFVVLLDDAMSVIDLTFDLSAVPKFGFLRLFRLVRLLRTLLLVRRIRPLYLILHGFLVVCKPLCGLRCYLGSCW
jgi:hypothetical protein